eukprot:13667-Heterococcus_DN1.PRE.1
MHHSGSATAMLSSHTGTTAAVLPGALPLSQLTSTAVTVIVQLGHCVKHGSWRMRWCFAQRIDYYYCCAYY